MPGLVPGIHVLQHLCEKGVDGRVKPGHDEDYVTADEDRKLPHQFLHRAFQPLDRQRKHPFREQPPD
ncbi:MAG: hypothetical protein ACTHN2_21055, partial [Nitrobacter sp.]